MSECLRSGGFTRRPLGREEFLGRICGIARRWAKTRSVQGTAISRQPREMRSGLLVVATLRQAGYNEVKGFGQTCGIGAPRWYRRRYWSRPKILRVNSDAVGRAEFLGRACAITRRWAKAQACSGDGGFGRTCWIGAPRWYRRWYWTGPKILRVYSGSCERGF